MLTVLVFTQFIMTGKILGSMLEKANCQFVYYYGSLDGEQKRKAIDKFKQDDETKILVSALLPAPSQTHIMFAA